MSYFHEYFMWDGSKSLRAYSAPFDLSKYSPEEWITTEDSLDWLMAEIAKSRYHEIAPNKAIYSLRKASRIEIEALKLTEWKRASL